MLMLRKLEMFENCRTRQLYEEVFPEDSESFVDYYYQHKASENHIYVIEQYDSKAGDSRKTEVVSMLHLNPYRLSVCGTLKECHYIVAVATKEEHRRKGLMRRLIMLSLNDMYERKEPFTFLMPAAEAIYYPYGFRYMNSRRSAAVNSIDILRADEEIFACHTAARERGSSFSMASREKGKLWCLAAGQEHLEALSAFAIQYFENNYDIFAVRSRHYFEQLLKEQDCEGGRIVLLMNNMGLAGYFLASEKAAAGDKYTVVKKEVREAVIKEELLYQLPEAAAGWLGDCEKIKFLDCSDGLERLLAEEYGAETGHEPLMMGRIVHLESMIECLRSEKEISFYIIVEDEILIQNSGAYYCTLGNTKSSCYKVPEDEARAMGAAVVSAARLGEEIFKSKKVFLDEIV